MKDIIDFKCPYIEKSRIWNNADTFRFENWPEGILPVDVESIIEKRLKLNIEPMHGLLDELDIDAFLKSDFSGIVVDYKCYMDERFANRLRFSYAHELGHLVLHKDIYSNFPIVSLEDYKYFTLNVPDREYGFVEYQANEFAGRLLVPRDILINELENCIQQIKDMGLVDFLDSDPDSVLSRISPTICRVFGVSYQVIERRVEREGLWPPSSV